MEDFAAALESFDREQAAEAAAQAYDDNVVTGTVIKLTDKHVVVDVGSSPKVSFPWSRCWIIMASPSSRRAIRSKWWWSAKKPKAASCSATTRRNGTGFGMQSNGPRTKNSVVGTVLGRVKGGLTVDIGIKAFLPGSQLEIRPVRNLDGTSASRLKCASSS